jgi:hypothetical protein
MKFNLLLWTIISLHLFANAKQPNVILIMTDDQGYGDLGCHGNPILKTPNLDKLYSESVRFTDFHVSPFCTPMHLIVHRIVDSRMPFGIGVEEWDRHPIIGEMTISMIPTNGFTQEAEKEPLKDLMDIAPMFGSGKVCVL